MEIQIARSLEEVEALRKDWQQIHNREPSPRPDSDIDRFSSVIKANNNGMIPHIIEFKEGNEPIAMIIARIEQKNLKLKLGYKTLFNPELRYLSVVYGGVLGQSKREVNSVIISELIKQLKNREFDMIFFNHLDTHTEFYQDLQKISILMKGAPQQLKKHWITELPDTIEEFYEQKSRKHRQNLLKVIRKFNQRFPSNRFVKYTEKSDVIDFLKPAAEVSSKTYQNALGAGIINNEETKELLESAAENNWFDGNILFTDKTNEKPCAFHLGLNYKDTHYMERIGFDPALSKLNSGTFLLLKKLEDLCSNPDIKSMDYYFGNAEYKKRYGTKDSSEACVYLFAPRPYPILINSLQRSTTKIESVLRYIINKLGKTDKVKKYWRALLSKNGKKNPKNTNNSQ
jgi:hypothetical protein